MLFLLPNLFRLVLDQLVNKIILEIPNIFLGFAGFGFEPKPLNLPKAPRAACESIIDESTVPQEGPFLVHMSNLQFEIDEDDITNYFKGLKVYNN